jgi:hypothetical protein
LLIVNQSSMSDARLKPVSDHPEGCMVQRSTRERELYERCPSCLDGPSEAHETCEQCGGRGFVLTGLTMGMLSQFVHQIEGLARMGGSIHRLARRDLTQ